MSESEEENFCFFGKPLAPYDEDLFPKRRPIAVEEQIATDSNGRRRFHGAFTGGFSAGFFNTVGSLEGWTPSEFKSSRGDKQKIVTQNAEDFMDEEDMGEFGFAPNTVKSTKDYDTSKKRKRKVFSEGPIPGEPVLHSLLTAGNETIGYILLKNIGIQEKVKSGQEELASTGRVYGCEMPKQPVMDQSIQRKDYEIPSLYQEYLSKPKNDTFGLAYQGLDKSHVNLFKSSSLVVHEKDKKLSIHGQAFGVGAFENDDDDIYSKEDMSNYDFELTKEKEKPVNSLKNSRDIIYDMFIPAKKNLLTRKTYPPPVIPKSFTGKYKTKKSRFEPLTEVKTEEPQQRNVNPTVRAAMLGEEINTNSTKSKSVLPKQSSSRKEVKEETKSEDKQKEEKKGFDVNKLWDDRFVSSVQEDEATDILAPVQKYQSEHYSKEMRGAAKLKMFGPLTRISEDWQPCSLLCKRFNVPEPLADKPNSLRKANRSKNLIFQYQKHLEENLPLKPGLSSQSTPIEEESTQSTEVPVVKQELDEENEDKTEEIMDQSQNNDKQTETTNHEKDTEENKVEEIIDITDRLNIEEKTDLFKAVFLDSSDSEEEKEENERNDSKVDDVEEDSRQQELKSNILGETLFPKIKPVKEGILSGISFHKFTKRSEMVEKEKETNESMEEEKNVISEIDKNIYGPRLPEKNVTLSLNSSKDFSKKSDSSDEWVEKDDLKRVKKHKKEKSHKKKHKHKKNKKSH